LSEAETSISRQVPEVFLPALKPVRYLGLWGGRGGAKSHFCAEEVTLAMYAKPTRVVCIREVQSSIRESVRQLVIDKIEAFGLKSFFHILDDEIRAANGGLMIFKGMQSYNATNIKSLEGYDIAWCEEAQTMSPMSLRMLRPTIRKPGSRMIFSWNPRFPTDPVDALFRGNNPPKDSICVKSLWSDNPFLPNELRDEMERDYLDNPAMAHHVWGGGYEVVTEGAYYGADMAAASLEYRITEVGHDKSANTYAAWDLGIGDATAIWVFQIVNSEWHFINYYQNRGKSMDHYIEWVDSLPFKINEHLLPHDARARELQTGKSRREFLEDRGLNTRVLEMHAVDDGIQAVRQVLNRCWFDATNCEQGINSLRMYRSEYSDKNGEYKNRPLHDQHSHCADAFRYAVMGVNEKFIANLSDWSEPISRDVRGTFV
jgi:phage terminase large subunit